MIRLIVFFLFVSSIGWAQEQPEASVDVAARPKGGKEDVEFVFRSQVIYPEALLKQKIAQDVAIYFTVTATGEVRDVNFRQTYETAFQAEARRLLRYVVFEPAKIGAKPVESTSFLVFSFDPDKYRKFTKMRGFTVPKDQALYDTTFVIYERADKSPQYEKGDDALPEFILSNLEYPDLAIRQNIQGTVVVSFVVEPNGTVSNMVAEKEFSQLCTAEAFRIMRQTRWKPAEKDGKKVRYQSKYPIIFNLNNINKDNSMSEQR